MVDDDNFDDCHHLMNINYLNDNFHSGYVEEN